VPVDLEAQLGRKHEELVRHIDMMCMTNDAFGTMVVQRMLSDLLMSSGKERKKNISEKAQVPLANTGCA
jgi:hypothetical protein